MISALTLGNFKCFRKLELPLRRFTLLAGLNGMGKSSVIQSLLILRQSFLSKAFLEDRLDLAGELADLGTGQDVLLDGATEDLITIGLEWSESEGIHPPAVFKFAYDRTSDRLQFINRSEHPWIAKASVALGGKRQPFVGGFQYLCAERLGPRKFLPLVESHARRRDLGGRGEYVLHLLLEHGGELLGEDDPRIIDKADGRTLRQQVEAWLQDVSPGAMLGMEPVRAADAVIGSFSFKRSGDVPTMALRPTNVGFGLSYGLPVIVALLASPPDALVLLENPEAHMHPRGQTRLGQLAARAAAAGVQVIAETHSDHFMDGVRIDVREGLLDPKDAAFHYFDRVGAEAQVISPEIDQDGVLSDWPTGFFDQRDENLIRLLAPRG
jgi:predicted ATPase